MQSDEVNARTGCALVLMSGGIDSMACAHFLRNQHFRVRGLFVDYGQKAAIHEKDAVSRVAETLGIAFETAGFASSRRFGAGEIPARNGLLAMMALAVSGAETRVIATGIHRGTPYYDCSPAFAQRMDTLIQEYSSGLTTYLAPFLTWSKRDIFEYCHQERLNLTITYSCEAGTMPPCGECASCRDRRWLDVR